MDTVTFLHTIETPQPKYPDYLVTSFDYLLTLYQIIGAYPIQSMEVLSDNGGVAIYQIEFSNKESMDSLCTSINQYNSTITIYGRVFHIDLSCMNANSTKLSLQAVA